MKIKIRKLKNGIISNLFMFVKLSLKVRKIQERFLNAEF
jgi:hypothetical protein